MLGAFEDAELEPNEMQEVAFHLARCESCAGVLSDYSTVGRELRSLAMVPVVPGFANAVIARIDRLPQPWFRRIERFFGRGTDLIGAGFAWGGAIAAVAILTAIILTPYAQQFAGGRLPAATSAASQNQVVADATAGEPAMADNDSHADISRLESGNPSVAVWSEPRKDTTVIWLPDQP
jgi:anti-sigma factor RsiW